MELNLKKPIIFFDLETTGVDISKDRIVEICYIKVWPDGREVEYSRRINPGMHIPEGASAVHGIYDEDDMIRAKMYWLNASNAIKETEK